MADTKLENLAESVSSDILSRAGISDEAAEKLTRLHEEAIDLGGTVDQDITVPITNGRGSGETKKTTWGVTIKGYFEITEPSNGTWTITAKDGGNTVFSRSGIKKGDKVDFSYKTGFKLDLKIEAIWSEGGNTTLEAHIHATY